MPTKYDVLSNCFKIQFSRGEKFFFRGTGSGDEALLARLLKQLTFVRYYLLTESEVITGKSQTEALMY